MRRLVVAVALMVSVAVPGVWPASAATVLPPLPPFALACVGADGVALDSCPALVYQSGGSVQTNPRIYVLFWGSQWGNAPYSGQLKKVTSFFRALPGSDWVQVLQGYRGATGAIQGVSFAGAGLDSSDPPVLSPHPDAQIDPEIQSAAQSLHWTLDPQTQVIVFTQPNSSSSPNCGIHGSDGNADGALFAWIPYPTDAAHNNSNCRAVYPYPNGPSIPIPGDMTAFATHELAENATSAAWQTNPAVNGSEIGDPCNGLVAPFDRNRTAGTYVQYILDSAYGRCADYQIDTPTLSPDSTANALQDLWCASQSSCVAVGSAGPGGDSGPQVPLAETWNGATWSEVPIPPDGYTLSRLTSIDCSDIAACTATVATDDGGTSLRTVLERWNGTAWSQQNAATPATAHYRPGLLDIACPAATTCFAVGGYTDTTGANLALVEQWNGTAWRIQRVPTLTGDDTLDGVSCVSTSFCLAVGYSYVAGGTQPFALTWNGTAWRKAANPASTFGAANRPVIAGVSCVSTTQCTAVGSITQGSSLPIMQQWNGATWSNQSGPIVPGDATTSWLTRVSCPAWDSCLAVGTIYRNGVSRAFAATWDATTQYWNPSPIPDVPTTSGASLNGVACTATNLCLTVGNTGTSTLAAQE